MTDKNYNYDNPPQGISWARIGGNAFAIGLHAIAFMLMLVPVATPDAPDKDDEVTQVSFIEPPPPPPPNATPDNPAGIRFQDGGVVPGSGRGDKIPANSALRFTVELLEVNPAN